MEASGGASEERGEEDHGNKMFCELIFKTFVTFRIIKKSADAFFFLSHMRTNDYYVGWRVASHAVLYPKQLTIFSLS
jgi:hypothetical protein